MNKSINLPSQPALFAGTSTLMKALAWHLEQPFEEDEVMVHQVRLTITCTHTYIHG